MLFNVSPWLSVSLSTLALLVAIIALIVASDIPSPDVRTLFRRRRQALPPPAPPLFAWLPIVAALPEAEGKAFLAYARQVRSDVDDLEAEYAEALYATYRQWARPDLPTLDELLQK